MSRKKNRSTTAVMDPPEVEVQETLPNQLHLPQWPTEPFQLYWPWPDLDPQVGDVVGWNWETKEVAVITSQPPIQNSRPWKVEVSVKPMPPSTQEAYLVTQADGHLIRDMLWYTTWNRAGLRQSGSGERSYFAGPCSVIAVASTLAPAE